MRVQDLRYGNIKQVNDTSNTSENQIENNKIGNVGEVIEAEVIISGENTVLNVNGTKVNTKFTNLENVKQGDKIKLQVTANDDNKVILKLVDNKTFNVEFGKVTNTQIQKNTEMFVNNLNKNTSNIEVKSEKETIKDIQKIVQVITKEDVEILVNEGVDIENISIDELNETLKQVKNDVKIPEINYSLVEENTDNNYQNIKDIKNIDDSKNIQNEVIKSKYTKEQWDYLEPTIDAFLKSLNIDVNDETRNIVKNMIEKDIPLTEDNFRKNSDVIVINEIKLNNIEKNENTLKNQYKNTEADKSINSDISLNDKKKEEIKATLNELTQDKEVVEKIVNTMEKNEVEMTSQNAVKLLNELNKELSDVKNRSEVIKDKEKFIDETLKKSVSELETKAEKETEVKKEEIKATLNELTQDKEVVEKIVSMMEKNEVEMTSQNAVKLLNELNKELSDVKNRSEVIKDKEKFIDETLKKSVSELETKAEKETEVRKEEVKATLNELTQDKEVVEKIINTMEKNEVEMTSQNAVKLLNELNKELSDVKNRSEVIKDKEKFINETLEKSVSELETKAEKETEVRKEEVKATLNELTQDKEVVEKIINTMEKEEVEMTSQNAIKLLNELNKELSDIKNRNEVIKDKEKFIDETLKKSVLELETKAEKETEVKKEEVKATLSEFTQDKEVVEKIISTMEKNEVEMTSQNAVKLLNELNKELSDVKNGNEIIKDKEKFIDETLKKSVSELETKAEKEIEVKKEEIKATLNELTQDKEVVEKIISTMEKNEVEMTSQNAVKLLNELNKELSDVKNQSEIIKDKEKFIDETLKKSVSELETKAESENEVKKEEVKATLNKLTQDKEVVEKIISTMEKNEVEMTSQNAVKLLNELNKELSDVKNRSEIIKDKEKFIDETLKKSVSELETKAEINSEKDLNSSINIDRDNKKLEIKDTLGELTKDKDLIDKIINIMDKNNINLSDKNAVKIFKLVNNELTNIRNSSQIIKDREKFIDETLKKAVSKVKVEEDKNIKDKNSIDKEEVKATLSELTKDKDLIEKIVTTIEKNEVEMTGQNAIKLLNAVNEELSKRENRFLFNSQKQEKIDKVLKTEITKLESQKIDDDFTEEKQTEKIEQSLSQKTQDKDLINKIVESLKNSNLPFTEENAMDILNTVNKTLNLDKIDDKMAKYLIDNELSLTIKNIYKSEYSVSNLPLNNKKLTNSEWQQLKPQIEKRLESEQIEITNEKFEQAKWLLENELPITRENLDKLDDIKEFNQNGIDKDIVVKEAINTIKNLDTIENTSIIENRVDKKANDLFQNVNKITDKAIDNLVSENKDINLKNLSDEQKRIDEQNQDKNEQVETEKQQNYTEEEIKSITAKRQLEEIRLRMTADVSRRLVQMDINIDTKDLSEVVDNLRKIEDEYYKNMCRKNNVEPTKETIKTLKETVAKVTELSELPSYTLGNVIKNEINFTVDDLYKTGTNLKLQLENANQTYDVMMTQPRADLGDSFSKAFSNIDNLLKDIDMETTVENRRAVKILGYNSMEISKDNIIKVKNLDNEVNTLIDNFHPKVAMDFIKKGINPINTPIDELNSQILETKEELGIQDEEKYSKFLYDLERNESISADERKTFIGIYRLLNNIEKSQGRAIGSVLKQGQDMTLSNLLTANRTAKSSGIDAKVNDNFGELEEVKFKSENITDQLKASFEKSNNKDNLVQNELNDVPTEAQAREISYQKKLLNNILENITSEKLEYIKKEIESSPLELSLEKFNNLLNQAPVAKKTVENYYVEQEVRNIRELKDISEKTIKILNDYNIPTTLNNLVATEQMMSNDGGTFKELKQKLEKEKEKDKESVEEVEDALSNIEESLIDKQSMKDAFSNLGVTFKEMVHQTEDVKTITSKEISSMKQIMTGINIMEKLSEEENYIIPITVNDEVINMNLKIVRGKDTTGLVSVNLDTQNLGSVSAVFEVNNKSVDIHIGSMSSSGTRKLMSNQNMIINAVRNAGLSVSRLDISNQNQQKVESSFLKQNQTNEATTNSLYRLSKNFVTAIKNIEIS